MGIIKVLSIYLGEIQSLSKEPNKKSTRIILEDGSEYIVFLSLSQFIMQISRNEGFYIEIYPGKYEQVNVEQTDTDENEQV